MEGKFSDAAAATRARWIMPCIDVAPAVPPCFFLASCAVAAAVADSASITAVSATARCLVATASTAATERPASPPRKASKHRRTSAADTSRAVPRNASRSVRRFPPRSAATSSGAAAELGRCPPATRPWMGSHWSRRTHPATAAARTAGGIVASTARKGPSAPSASAAVTGASPPSNAAVACAAASLMSPSVPSHHAIAARPPKSTMLPPLPAATAARDTSEWGGNFGSITPCCGGSEHAATPCPPSTLPAAAPVPTDLSPVFSAPRAAASESGGSAGTSDSITSPDNTTTNRYAPPCPHLLAPPSLSAATCTPPCAPPPKDPGCVSRTACTPPYSESTTATRVPPPHPSPTCATA
mmetsp:Transcript_3230/g.7970  ORF Transcript_3230/g.7970 Transcript_3230/m.7970 type:complete len:356 (-) Transcript_3230:21-1088(-)